MRFARWFVPLSIMALAYWLTQPPPLHEIFAP